MSQKKYYDIDRGIEFDLIHEGFYTCEFNECYFITHESDIYYTLNINDAKAYKIHCHNCGISSVLSVKKPIEDLVFHFGKHMGERMIDVDINYIQWMLEHGDNNRSFKIKLERVLNHKTKGENMFGTKEQKPSNEDKKFAGLGAGVYAVTLDDVVSGTSDKTGNLYWIIKLSTEAGIQFDHFVNTTESEYKTAEKVFNAASRQMEALLIYDSIGEHKDMETWMTNAIDKTYALKGKKIEFTIQDWAFNGKTGTWGQITGYLDTPNESIQNVGKKPVVAVDKNEEIPF